MWPAFPIPVGETLAEWTRPNGLRIRKVRVPLGVVGIIYESRPNVTVDCASLVLKTGNAIVLRGGKEAVHSNQKLVEILNQVDGVPDGRDRIAGFEHARFRARTDQGARPGGRADPARRPGADFVCGRQCHRAGDRNRSRELPHLRRRVRRFRDGGRHRDQCQDAASVGVQRGGKAAGARSASRRNMFRAS